MNRLIACPSCGAVKVEDQVRKQPSHGIGSNGPIVGFCETCKKSNPISSWRIDMNHVVGEETNGQRNN